MRKYFLLNLFCYLVFHAVNVQAANNVERFENYLTQIIIQEPAGPLANRVFELALNNPTLFDEQLDLLQPAWYGDLYWSAQNTLANAGQVISNNLLARVREYRGSSLCGQVDCIPYRNIWVAGLGGHLDQDRLHQLPAFRTNDWGLLGGFDFVCSDWLTVGLAGGYIHSDLKWDDLSGNNSIHNFFIGPYVAWNRRCLTIEASLLKGTHRFHTHKDIHLGLLNSDVRSTQYGDSIFGHMGLSLNYGFNVFEFQPFLYGDYTYIHYNGLKEKGKSVFDLKVKSDSIQFFQGEVGAQLTSTFRSNCATIVPTVKGGFQNITPITGTKFTANLRTHPRRSFEIQTTTDPIYQWTAGMYINIIMIDGLEFSVSYDGAFSNKRKEYCYTGEVDWYF
jgi:outer membrane autotransporter protein